VNSKWDKTIQKATSKIQSERLQTCLEFQNLILENQELYLDSKENQSSFNLEDQTIFDSSLSGNKTLPESTKTSPNNDSTNQTDKSISNEKSSISGSSSNLEIERNSDYRFGEFILKEFEKKNIPKILIYIFYLSNILLIVGLLSVPYYAFFDNDYYIIKDIVEWGDVDPLETEELVQNDEVINNDPISEEVIIDNEQILPVAVDDEIVESIGREEAIIAYDRITYISTIIPFISLFYNSLFLALMILLLKKRQNIYFLNIALSFLTGLYMFSWFFGFNLHWLIDGIIGFGSFFKSFVSIFFIVISLIINYKLLKSYL
jgi:hypothetical protein